MSTIAEDRRLARNALKVLDRNPTIYDADGHAAELPDAAIAGLRALLEVLADGESPTVVRHPTSLTTQQAADMLNVSRPHVVKLIDAGDIPSHKVGAHRRVALSDLIAYRDRRATEQDDPLTAMSEQAEDLGLYDR